MLSAEEEAAKEKHDLELKRQRMENEGMDWVDADLANTFYKMDELDPIHEYAVFKPYPPTTLLGIFLKIVTVGVLRSIWDSYDITTWSYSCGTCTGILFKGDFKPQMLYVYFAVYIRILGLQDAPNEARPMQNPLRQAIQMALGHFAARSPTDEFPSRMTIETLMGRFHIRKEQFGLIFDNARSLLRWGGRWIVGDEKLLKYFGNSGFIRVIPSKPDHIGLWFYECVVNLEREKSFLYITAKVTQNLIKCRS